MATKRKKESCFDDLVKAGKQAFKDIKDEIDAAMKKIDEDGPGMLAGGLESLADKLGKGTRKIRRHARKIRKFDDERKQSSSSSSSSTAGAETK